MTERMQYDAPKLTRDEATELCVYHLRMAASLFQLGPDDSNKALHAEINRQCKDDIDAVDVKPAMEWAKLMLKGYKTMEDDD